MNEYNFFFWCSGMREDLHYHILTFSTWYRAPCGVIIRNYQIINNILDTKLSSYRYRKANKNYEEKKLSWAWYQLLQMMMYKNKHESNFFVVYIKNAALQLFSKKEKSYLLLANDNNWLSIWWCFFNDSPDTGTFITHSTIWLRQLINRNRFFFITSYFILFRCGYNVTFFCGI